MDAVVKASLYIGTVLLVGAGGYRYFVASSSHRSWVLCVSVATGLVLVVSGSVSNVILTVMNVLGRFDAGFIWEYAVSTQHGQVTFIRLGLALLLVPFVLLNVWGRMLSVLFSIVGLGFLSTFSLLSHATVMDGTLAFFADLVHFACASLWVGAVLFSVSSKVWKQPNFEMVIKRVSTLALVCVTLLVATGIYTSLIHINTFALLFGTEYGRVLLVKVGIFSLILLLAALNRWYFMPQLLARQAAFQKVLLVEVVLLLVVLVVTGLLTVSPLPHDMA
jgi:putative copper export protein